MPDNKHSGRERQIAAIQPDQARTYGLERAEELAAGQYWRSVRKIPAKKHSFRSHKNGKWTGDGRDALGANVTLLVTSLRHVDGELHTVILAPHPLEAKDVEERRFLRDEFFANFERELDPAGIRAAEIAGVETDIKKLQQQLIDGPKDLPRLNPMAAAPTMNALIQHADKAAEIRRVAEQSVALSQKRATWVQEKVEGLAASTELLAFFHKEQAAAALAQVEDTIRYVKHLDSGIQTLGLYTGEGVKVVRLTEGDPAPAGSSLTLYQRKLFMDEEWAIHLADGGADYSNLAEFAEALAQDPKLMERLLPAPLSAVVMTYRRNDKEYFSENDARSAIARALANATANEPNRDTFLLARNGENLTQIFSEATTNQAKRLFPTAAEVEKLYRKGSSFFRGMDAEEITSDDLLYTDAREEHDQVAVFYKRMLVLLWGLNDRLGLFGEFCRPGISWLGQEFQARHFNFVYDDEGALEDGRPSFDDFVKRHNANLQAGSRVVCDWKRIMDPNSAPGATKWIRSRDSDRVEFRYLPDERLGFAILRRKGEDLTVQVACHYNSWREVARKNAEMSVSITEAAKNNSSWRPGLLCLDAVKSDDLDYYINSRRQREHYLNYLELFVFARNRLRAEEAQAAPFVAAVRKALADAGIAGRIRATEDKTPDQVVDQAIEDSIRLWRANRFGRTVPAPGERDWKEVLGQIGAQIYRLLGLSATSTDTVEAAITGDGRSILRLVSTGSGKLIAYATPTAAEAFETAGPFPWAARIEIATDRKGAIALGAPKLLVMPKNDPAEHVVREWPAGSAWVEARPNRYKLAYDEVAKFRTNLAAPNELAELLAEDKTLPADRFDHWLTVLRMQTRALSTGNYVREPKIFAPVAAYAVHGVEGEGSVKTDVLVVSAALSAVLWARADQSQRSAMRDWLKRTYAQSDKRATRMDEAVEGRYWLGLEVINLRGCIKEIGKLTGLPFVADDVSGYGVKRPATAAGVLPALRAHYIDRGHRKKDITVRRLDWVSGAEAAFKSILKAWPGQEEASED